MDLIYGLGGSALVRLAYRIVAAKSLKFFNAIKHNLVVDEDSTEQTGATPSYSIQVFFWTNYRRLYGGKGSGVNLGGEKDRLHKLPFHLQSGWA